ncbi:MAG TPA: GNAT family N-acetyltransferase [Ktedonobacterales bacterium]|nr:GNAT family N-acetyltransferase [Ktedonobacterales bacterium]
MIYELAAEDYHRVRALVAGLTYHLSVQAVIDGTVAGHIWVDDLLNPQAAFMLTPEGQYLVGASDNSAFRQALADLLLTMPVVNLTYSPGAWESTFAALLTCKFARPYARHYYTFRRFLLPDWRELLPQGYEMAQVDQAFLARQDLAHLDDVRDWTANWTDFARDGFGFCLLHDGAIVSHCIADCVSGHACEVGIVTQRDYQRRGLGALTVAATVEHCLERQLSTIGWHCLANNRGSQRVAEKVGFEFVGAYVQYANSVVAENANDLTPPEWRAEGEYFERAAEMLRQHETWMAWRAAKAHAVAGNHAHAMILLQRLADSKTMLPGWDAWLREGWEFQGMQAAPEWPTLLARAQAAPPAEGEAAN